MDSAAHRPSIQNPSHKMLHGHYSKDLNGGVKILRGMERSPQTEPQRAIAVKAQEYGCFAR
ncbi:MAG: hypothetical protein ACFCA4_13900 [Cyanophyceae cyanobacterium]